MKKFFFMTLLAGLFLLPGCKKESKTDPTPEPTTNAVIDMFNYSKNFVGTDSAQVVTKLINDRWTRKSSTAEFVNFMKTENDITSVLGIFTNGRIVNEIDVYMADFVGETGLTDGNTMKEVMLYMGESYKYGEMTWPFGAMRYSEAGETIDERTYSVALEKVVDACNNSDIKLLWADNSHGVMFTKEYISESKMDVVTIMVK